MLQALHFARRIGHVNALISRYSPRALQFSHAPSLALPLAGGGEIQRGLSNRTNHTSLLEGEVGDAQASPGGGGAIDAI